MDAILDVTTAQDSSAPRGMSATRVEQCRSCGERSPRPFLSLGATPIANSLVTEDRRSEPDAAFELGVAFCPSCSLVQLTHDLPAEGIFDAAYPYFSSFSDSYSAHARRHAGNLLLSRNLGGDDLVVEIASNDGYLLKTFVDAGVRAIGIEPSPGPAARARELGLETIEAFFTREFARSLRLSQAADVIIANNVMAHVPDLDGFAAGLRALLAEDGLITIENPYVRDLIEQCEFDTIYHEHFSYFSCTSVANLMRRNGLFLNDVEYFPKLHGGTLRWYVAGRSEPTPRLLEYLVDEERRGLTTFAYYENFGTKVERVVADLRDMIGTLKGAGATIAAYGAAAKGATLLNVARIGMESIDFVADRNPYKQGKWMPGARIPIVDPSEIGVRKPDYLLLLAWNLAEEIMTQQAEFRRHGGRFIIPVPNPRVV